MSGLSSPPSSVMRPLPDEDELPLPPLLEAPLLLLELLVPLPLDPPLAPLLPPLELPPLLPVDPLLAPELDAPPLPASSLGPAVPLSSPEKMLLCCGFELHP
jgi:hypothetical protein